jgi:hypothetical protein
MPKEKGTARTSGPPCNLDRLGNMTSIRYWDIVGTTSCPLPAQRQYNRSQRWKLAGLGRVEVHNSGVNRAGCQRSSGGGAVTWPAQKLPGRAFQPRCAAEGEHCRRTGWNSRFERLPSLPHVSSAPSDRIGAVPVPLLVSADPTAACRRARVRLYGQTCRMSQAARFGSPAGAAGQRGVRRQGSVQ